MREITTHRLASGQADPVNDCLEILADDVGRGGESSYYEILYRTPEHDGDFVAELDFVRHNAEAGLTNEVLLAVLIDRLEGLQHGPDAGTQERGALAYLHAALTLLKTRTRDRQERRKVDRHRGE